MSELAFAGSVARATVTQLAFTLTDLDPGDGIAPSLTFRDDIASTDDANATGLWFQMLGPSGDVVGLGWDAYYLAFHTFEASATVPFTTIRVSVRPEGVIAAASVLDSDAWSNGAELSYEASGGTRVERSDAFVLSPNTQLQVNAQLWAAASVGDRSVDGASARARIWLGGCCGGTRQEASAEVSLAPQPALAGSFMDEQRVLAELSYANTDSEATSLNFGFNGAIDGASLSGVIAPPVPEPATTVLMTIGLLVLASRIRQRT